MKAKELLKAAFILRNGRTYQPIAKQIVQGEIKPNATYIQTFHRTDFCCVEPDVVFVTTANETCYLYKVD